MRRTAQVPCWIKEAARDETSASVEFYPLVAPPTKPFGEVALNEGEEDDDRDHGHLDRGESSSGWTNGCITLQSCSKLYKGTSLIGV